MANGFDRRGALIGAAILALAVLAIAACFATPRFTAHYKVYHAETPDKVTAQVTQPPNSNAASNAAK
jgi:uncharacterized protein YciW